MIAGATVAAVQVVRKGVALVKISGVVQLPVVELAGRDFATMPDLDVARPTVDHAAQSAVALTVALNPAVAATAAASVTADCVETVAPVVAAAAAAVAAVAVYAATATAIAVVPVAPAKPAAVAAPSETADRTSAVGQDGPTAGSGATAVGADSVRSTAEQTPGRTATDSELRVALATGATAAAVEKVVPGVSLLRIAGQRLTTSNRNCPKNSIK